MYVFAFVHALLNLKSWKHGQSVRPLATATASAAALASYVQDRDTYPSAMRLLYGITGSKAYDMDIHDLDRRGFVYRVPKVRKSVDIGRTRVWLEPGVGLLYSVGRDGIDGLAARHINVESGGDLLIWPPAHTLVREQPKSCAPSQLPCPIALYE